MSDRGGEGFLTHAAEKKLRADLDKAKAALREIADPRKSKGKASIARRALIDLGEDDEWNELDE